MVKATNIIVVSLCITTFLLVPACRKKQNQPTDNSQQYTQQNHESVNEAPETPTSTVDGPGLEEILKLWRDGKNEDAIDIFLSTKWDGYVAPSTTSILNLSEKEFVKLPESERTTILKKSMELTMDVRRLSQRIVELGNEYRASKSIDLARKHYQAVLDCGKALAGSELLDIIKMTGTVLQEMALQELDRIPAETKE